MLVQIVYNNTQPNLTDTIRCRGSFFKFMSTYFYTFSSICSVLSQCMQCAILPLLFMLISHTVYRIDI